jgi:nucleoredoxin
LVWLEFFFEILFFVFYFRCPPCRSFTPKLIKFYETHAEEKNFEIIFLSSDSDEESFDEYYKDMPWLKLNYDQQDKKDELEEKFEVDGIPTLILLDGDSGDVICTDARKQIQDKDKDGDKFPWKADK